MSIQIPEELQNLEANSGIYAIWMIFHHYGIELNISDLVSLCEHDDEYGASSIALSVALKILGLDVKFYTDHDPDIQDKELKFYKNAADLKIQVEQRVLSYEEIQNEYEAGRFIIVFYDTLEGVGNHSLVYEINGQEISFFDSFESMPKAIFEQQRKVEGICQQVIVIDDRNFVERQIG
ncbi:peptidase C39 [Acinetobacter sp. NCu2D-2]|uniref:cysteine peptidase family C39 domain-containing protein n=1 Tax=Acinetobacter sp. NCu2D-2 TaxID=1608473 RepID=UPI0007CDAA22|nr:cysteine peptidase family C39 domain-containing protein [Acinetobacter sp. NCu2D-2]ANF82414.1 peptidase C39 [Acinetobacter sp. NCu2D-2]